MNVHVLQHVAFEELGSIEDWLTVRGARLTYSRFHESASLPALDGIDLVIAMGGPMSANDEAALPWLRDEKRFLRDAIVRGLPVLGICLGAQLIAAALGARVYPASHKEIGWFEVEATPAPEGCFRFPGRVEVFHWHGETFDLPPGAVRLAKSAVCENQAFQLGANVIGLQCHLETTPESAESLIAHCRDELVDAPWIQTEAALRAAPPDTYARIGALMGDLLAYLTRPRG